MTRSVAIVGAGMAGLACASRLAEAGVRAALFDKARGPGGRMSTRRIETPSGQVSFDHGAQYFTARGAAFRARVEAWAAAGLVAPWPPAGPDAWVGTPGMNAPVRALAETHGVAFGHRVEALIPDGEAWRLVGPLGSSEPFEAVLLAMPAEQTAALLAEVEPSMAQVAAASDTDPCWTVMAAFDQRLAITTDILRDQGPLGWAARNSSKPGRAPVEAWVMQGSPAWSRRHLEDAAGDVCRALLEVLGRSAGTPVPQPIALQAHRWRFARSAAGVERALWSPGVGIGCCGDWLIGPRVECAWESGVTLADRVIADL